MRNRWRLKQGQAVMETGVLLFVVTVALIAMQVYLKRGIQGRLRSGIDSIGEQYDPYQTDSDFLMTHESNVITNTYTQDLSIPIDLCHYEKRLETVTAVNTIYDNTTRVGSEFVGAP